MSGITGVEILFGHVTTQFLVMCGQTTLVLIFSFSVFGITLKGEILWVILLVVMTGLCGMTFGEFFEGILRESYLIRLYFLGFVVSCSVDNERSATYMAMGSFLPIVMLCGIIWPIEGMHPLLSPLSAFLPLTKSTESLRSILQRGWPINDPHIYYGYLSTGIWILVFLTISILLLKFKKG